MRATSPPLRHCEGFMADSSRWERFPFRSGVAHFEERLDALARAAVGRAVEGRAALERA
jgi:hypothetical protein